MSGVILEEIERSLLNAIIEGDMSFDDLKGMGLCAEDFSSETHHLIFESMGRLHEKREPIDVLNLCNELDGTSRPNGRAWSSYITNVLGVALQIGDITYHVKKIQEASRLRKLSEAGYRLYEAAQKGDAESVHSWRKKITEFKTPQEKDRISVLPWLITTRDPNRG